MQKKVFGLLFTLFITIFFISLSGVVEAFDQITAQEAYNMVSSGEATLLDVRTLEEYTFVGSPALDAGGEPIAYLISWKLFDGIDDNGHAIYKDNPDFDALVEQTFGSSKNRALIVMCKVGGRSTYAANRLEQLGFTSVYEIDNRLKELASPPGGCGGFQGSNYQAETNGYYYGYTGYPGRLPSGSTPSSIKVATVTDQIENKNDSVSWMDTGLPITQKVDPKKIPKLKKVDPPPTQPSDNKTNLPGTNLIGTNLTGNNFAGTNLVGTNLFGTNLFTGVQSILSYPYLGSQAPYLGYPVMPYSQQPAYPAPAKDYSSTIPQANWFLPDQLFFQQLYIGPSLVYTTWQNQNTSSTGLTSASSVYTTPQHT